MDKEIVFGNRISVNFLPKVDADLSESSLRDHFKYSTEESSLSSSSCSSRDSSVSPPQERIFYSQECPSNNVCSNALDQKKFNFPPPPIIDEKNFPIFLKQEELMQAPSLQIDNQGSSKSYSSTVGAFNNSREKRDVMNWNYTSSFCIPSDKHEDVPVFSCKKEQDYNSKTKYFHRNVGRVSPFLMQDCDSRIAKNGFSLNGVDANRRNSFHADTPSSATSVFSNHAHHSLSQTVPMPFCDIQRISNPVAYSSQWSGNSVFPVEPPSTLSRTNTISSDCSSSVELQVSNLDTTFEVNEMKKILLTVFSEHVMVLHISMSLQPDGSAKASVKVPSLQDAQYAISRLHRKKIGHKRILISYSYSEKNPPFQVLRTETVALLNDIPAKSLPLIKFRELYEKRYHRPIAVSELYKMRDAVTIHGDSGSRMVYLNVNYCKTPSLTDSEDSQDFNSIERPYCERHFHVSASQGWAEQYSICPLPLICISLKLLSTAVHRLLDTHQGSLPLISFCDCYEAEIGPLPVICNATKDNLAELCSTESELSKEYKGVPLEHLIACVNGVEVTKSTLCIKKVQWLENKMLDTQVTQNLSPALAGQLTLFGREVIDLLKSQPQCLVAFNKFIPTYHHHFGRQCRVADYGFTKLIDLLEAVPHIVQVLGEGQNRQVTLTHRAQVKRFSAELLRILKSRASKQISTSEFPAAYEQVIEKPFEITNYGVCEIEDMLEEVSENVIVICSSGDETIIGIPKREQTAEEIERTKQFAVEVIELMKHTPCCSMAFNKFIPAYHHHFGKQCRVADYGFTKLIELFEAIPDVLEVAGTGEDKILSLIQSEQHKILTQRLVAVLKSQPNEVIDLNQISSSYAQMHGHALRPTDFGFTDLHNLVEHMNAFRVVIGYVKTYITLVDEKAIHQISLNLRTLLMEELDGKLPITKLCERYEIRFSHKINPSLLFKDMTKFIKVDNDLVQLTPLSILARQIIFLLKKEDGQVEYGLLRSVFHKYFHFHLNPMNYGCINMHSLFEDLSDYFLIKGKKLKRIIFLNSENTDVLKIPDFMASAQSILERKVKRFDQSGFETPPSHVLDSTEAFNCKINNCTSKDHFCDGSITVDTIIPHSKEQLSSSSSDVSSSNSNLHILTKPVSCTSEWKEISQTSPMAKSMREQSSIQKLCQNESSENNCYKPTSCVSSIDSSRHSHIGNLHRSSTPEDFTGISEKFSKDVSSSKSTPIKQQNRRNRIAAQFSMPMEL